MTHCFRTVPASPLRLSQHQLQPMHHGHARPASDSYRLPKDATDTPRAIVIREMSSHIWAHSPTQSGRWLRTYLSTRVQATLPSIIGGSCSTSAAMRAGRDVCCGCTAKPSATTPAWHMRCRRHCSQAKATYVLAIRQLIKEVLMHKIIVTLGFSLFSILSACGVPGEETSPEKGGISFASQALSSDESGQKRTSPHVESVGEHAVAQQESIAVVDDSSVTTINLQYAGQTVRLSVRVRNSEHVRMLTGTGSHHQARQATDSLTETLQRMVDSGKLNLEGYQQRSLMVDRSTDSLRCWRVWECDCSDGVCHCTFVGIICD